jgi:hypothetical protein
MDFAWICTEHSAFNLETVVDLVANAHAARPAPIGLRQPAGHRAVVARSVRLGIPRIRLGVISADRSSDVSGRPQVLLMLERLIEYISVHSGARWCPMEEMAEEFRRRHPFKS